jgi:thiol-disulfide isomerase/thioredoxin
LSITLLIGSTLYAGTNEKVVDFLEESFSANPNVSHLKVKVEESIKLKELDGWNGLIVNVDATVKTKTKDRKINQKMVWFTNGSVITKELIDLDTGLSIRDSVVPKFKETFYKKENLIYGNINAKHKVAIFSDPLCPFCRKFVPRAIRYMKKYPNKFAIYYYHFPLDAIHPASVELTQAAIVAESLGKKDVVLKLYDVEVNARERDVKKILKAFNNVFLTDIKPSDLKSSFVKRHLKSDTDIASNVMVQGTPTMFFDGTIDKTKKKYKEAK